MAFTKYIVPALALTGAVAAQCNGPSITISSTADAAAIQGCQTYKGDVIISSDATGEIDINGVQQITGDLRCNNATGLNSIKTDQLNSIAGTFALTGLTTLTNLQFDSLTGVNNVQWVGLPNLQGLNFAQGLSRVNNLVISNTDLYTLEGINLEQVGSIDINNNFYLDTINVNDLTNVTNALSISANGRNLQIAFPNLQGAANLTFINVTSIDMPSLSQVVGSMGFYSDLFQDFSAPNLTIVGGTVAFVDSPNLKTLNFPKLGGIGGGLLIANNTALDSLTGFPKLQVIAGALDLAGDFSTIKFPALRDVRGGSTVQTSSTQNVCQLFNQLASNQVIKGVNDCKYNQNNPTTGTPSSSGSSASASATKNAAIANFDPSAPLTGLSAIIAALLFL